MAGSDPDHEVLAAVLRVAAGYVEDGELDGPWFDLGGSSVDAARLVSWLEREHGVPVELKALLTAGSVRDCLADAVARAGDGRPVTRPDGVDDSTGTSQGVPAGPAARPSTNGSDILWPALMQLPVRERVRLAHRLLEDLLQRPELAG